MFLPQCERPCLTPIQNNRQNYPFPLLKLYQRIRPDPRVFWMSRNLIIFYDELLAHRPTPKLEGHPLSAVRDCLFNAFAATLHIRRPFLHPQPEEAPCRCDRDRLIIHTYIHTYTYMHTYIQIWVLLCVYIYIYIYIYMSIHTCVIYIYIYTYIHTHTDMGHCKRAPQFCIWMSR
jgi:hypothetical protein